MIVENLFEKIETNVSTTYSGEDIDLVTCDSRKCRRGSVFVAIKGSMVDGHDYVEEALKQGAQIIVCQTGYKKTTSEKIVFAEDTRSIYVQLNRTLWLGDGISLKLIAVTGTNGKTSTTHMIQHLLGGRNQCGLLGTIRCEGGSVSVESTHTTPDPEILYPMLRQMHDDGCRFAVLEASSHALDQGRLAGLVFDVAVFTNVTQDHLDYHGDMESYLAAKLKLRELVGVKGHLLYNSDDSLLRSHMQLKGDMRVVSAGLNSDADVRVSIRHAGLDGSDFCLKYKNQEFDCRISMVGEHNVMNAAMAMSACAILGEDLKKVSGVMSEFSGVSGRMERIETGRDLFIYIDYAHTDDGLKNVLSSIKPLVKGRLLLLFGCGGDRDKGKRPLMAKVAQQYADFTVLTSDNPRSESPIQIIKDIEAGFSADFKSYTTQKDRKKAIRTIMLHARNEDVVVIAGKGHEAYQVIQDQKLTFSDKDECLKILQGL